MILMVIGFFLIQKISKKNIWVDARVQISSIHWANSNLVPPYWLVEDLKVGMVAYNSFGEEIAIIDNVDVFSVGGVNNHAWVDLKLKVSYDEKKKVHLFNFQAAQVGKPLDLTFGSNNVSGLVVSIGDDKREYQNKTIKVRMRALEDFIVDQFVVGLEMKDSKGRVIAKVNEVEVKPNNLNKVVFFNDEMYLTSNKFKDVIITVDIKSFFIMEEWRFIDQSVLKIGEDIWFQFPNIVVKSGTIVEIIE